MSSVDQYTLLTCASVKIAINKTCTVMSRSWLESYKRLVSVSAQNFNVLSRLVRPTPWSRLGLAK